MVIRYLTSKLLKNVVFGRQRGCNAGTTSQAYIDATFQTINYFRAMVGLPDVSNNAGRYQSSFEQLPELLDKRERHPAELEAEVKKLKHKLASGDAGASEIRKEVEGVQVLARRGPEMSPAELRNLADTMRQKLGSGRGCESRLRPARRLD